MLRHINGRNMLALAFGLVLAVLLLEFAGRILPIRMGFGESLSYLRFHPVLGTEVDPTVGQIDYKNNCVDIKSIAINSAGMRSAREYSLISDPEGARIALLGDSFIMGREVSDGEEAAAVIARRLSRGDVLNFGVPGYGSIQSLYAYDLKASSYSPDIVVLAFLEVNDVEDDSDTITSAAGWGSLRPVFDGNGELIAPDPAAWDLKQNHSFTNSLHRSLRRYSYTYYVVDEILIKRIMRRLRRIGESAPKANSFDGYWWAKDQGLLHAGVYDSSPDPVWMQAWSDTELAIERLNQRVISDGRRFVVMLLPSVGSSYSASLPKRYKDVIGEDMPASIDLNYPRNRLRAFTKSQGIEFLDLNENFETYMQIHQTSLPHFYYMCDGHFSPVGHYVVGHSLLGLLLRKGWVSPATVVSPEQYETDSYMQLSPAELLGTDAFDSIYGWAKVYEGSSDAARH